MAGGKSRKVPAAESQRRKAQSKRDKASSKRPSTTSGRKNPTKGGSGGSGKRPSSVARAKTGLADYTKLILDPCKAKLTPTPLPGREGSSLFRLPFRFQVTLNTATTNLTGATVTPSGSSNLSCVPCTSFTASLVPHAMVNNNAPPGVFAISVTSAANESAAVFTDNVYDNPSNYIVVQDPVGLSQLDTMSSMIRPVAGCIKCEFYSGTNTGSVIGYEGAVGQYFHHATSAAFPGAGTFVPTINASTLAMLGWSSTIASQGVEACVNIAAAPTTFHEFRALNSAAMVGNPDAGDVDVSQTPCAAVAVGGGTPGSSYLISGAVVYEWVPSITVGIAGAASGDRPLIRNQSALDTVIKQVASYGPMLVGVASSLVTGGPTLAISDLIYRLSINRNHTSDAPRLGWK